MNSQTRLSPIPQMPITEFALIWMPAVILTIDIPDVFQGYSLPKGQKDPKEVYALSQPGEPKFRIAAASVLAYATKAQSYHTFLYHLLAETNPRPTPEIVERVCAATHERWTKDWIELIADRPSILRQITNWEKSLLFRECQKAVYLEHLKAKAGSGRRVA